MSHDIDLDALQGFIDESNDSLQNIESDFIALEREPGKLDIINRIFRPIHSLKGNSGFFGLMNISKFSHRLENLLDFTRKGEVIITGEVIDTLLTGIDFLKKMLARAAGNPADTALRPEEEEFLARVAAHRPEVSAGSIQSVIDLEQLLNEALDLGMGIQEHALITDLLDQIEKANKKITKLIGKHADSAVKSAYSPDIRYFYEGEEYTEKIKTLGLAATCLARKEPLDRETLAMFVRTTGELGKLLKNMGGMAGVFAELSSMQNFLDDPMMIANAEYSRSFTVLVNQVLANFEAKGSEPDAARKLGEILVDQNLATTEQISRALNKQKKLGELLLEDGVINEEDLKKALDIQNKRLLDTHLKKDRPRETIKTIRIDQYKLDNFAVAVGDFYTCIDSINFIRKQVERSGVAYDLLSRFDNTIFALNSMVDALQSNIMSIRRVPVKGLFQRFPRVVRQLANSLGKDIRFVTAGEETVIDKDLLEKIENPLVHILRNAVDHGIELPAEREQKGKERQGVLDLAAVADENNICITIRDDGSGIDPEKMRRIAVTKGFLTTEQAAALSAGELVNLIFRPGFSSAEKVSDVSGRGVGMDVVLAGLHECNGTIDVESAGDEGTTVSITIPLTKTLVTKEAMVIEAGQTYVIPSEDVTTVIDTTGDIMPVLAGENCISHEGKILRVIDLNNFFGPDNTVTGQSFRNRLMIVCAEHLVALLVDRVVAHQKIVAKEFNGGYKKLKNIDGISGYTIMGNEEVILIVDVRKVAEQAG